MTQERIVKERVFHSYASCILGTNGSMEEAMKMLPPDTSLAKKDRKAWARYQTRIREIEIAAEERATGKKHRSRKISRSGRRKKR